MALASTTIWETRPSGSDTICSGAFDPGQSAGMLTDGAVTVATGNSPIFTSASYSFVAGDVGAYIFVRSGTNWAAGWYKIVSVSGGAATLEATINTVPLYRTVDATVVAMNTVAGCATVASPTGATWTIDYSRQNAAQFAYTDLASVGSGLLVSSVAFPFGKQQVGNSIVITGGTNFNTGIYVIASVSVGLVATVVGATNITSAAGVAGTGNQGGGLASPGRCLEKFVAGNLGFLNYGTFTLGTTSPNVSGGILSFAFGEAANRFIGYDIIRTELNTDTNKPTIVVPASGVTSVSVVACSSFNSLYFRNINVNGASKTAIRGLSGGTGSAAWVSCTITNCTNYGITGGEVKDCTVTGCTTQPAVSAIMVIGSNIYDNTTVTGIVCNNVTKTRCTGNTIGIAPGASNATITECTISGNSSHGISLPNFCRETSIDNNMITFNGGYGVVIGGSGNFQSRMRNNAFYSNTSGPTSIPYESINGNPITLSADPYTSKATNDFTLNNTATGGALCRGTGYPAYTDIGAMQHQEVSDFASIESLH